MRESCPGRVRSGDRTVPAPSRYRPGRDCGSAGSGGHPSRGGSIADNHRALGNRCRGIGRSRRAWSTHLHQSIAMVVLQAPASRASMASRISPPLMLRLHKIRRPHLARSSTPEVTLDGVPELGHTSEVRALPPVTPRRGRSNAAPDSRASIGSEVPTASCSRKIRDLAFGGRLHCRALKVDLVGALILTAFVNNLSGMLTLVGDPATLLVGSSMGLTFALMV